MRLLFIDGAESSGWQIDFFTSWDPLVNKTAHPILPHSEQWGLFCEAWEAKSWCSKTKLKFFQISPFLAEACCSFADSLCMPPSGNSTGQMGTTSAWPTQTAATAVSYLPTRKAPSVSNLLHLFVWLHERQHTLVTGQVITLKLSFFLLSRSLHWLWHRAALLDQLGKQHHQSLQAGWFWTGGTWGRQRQADQGYCSGYHG